MAIMNRHQARGRMILTLATAVAAAGLLAAVACGGGTSSGDKTATASAKQPSPAATKAGSATVAANGGSIPSNVGKDDKAQLTGAGATFPNPLYTRWFSDYKSGVAPGVEVNYQSIGSGGGVKQITEETVDFGASDAPLSDDEMAKAPGIQHIPTTLSAQPDATKGKALVDLLWWAVHDGQKTTSTLDYAPLPKDVVTMVEKTLTADITANGQPLLKAQ